VQEELPTAALTAGKVPPALVMGSDADPIVDVNDINASAEHVFADNKKVISGCGHDVMLDWRWEAFADELIGFVKTLS
jgi:alpha-beta hydrolase superfamily lysophospholipase